MAVTTYTTINLPVEGEPGVPSLLQATGQIIYPSVGSTDIDVYADIVSELIAVTTIQEYAFYKVYCSPAYILTPPFPSNLGVYPSNPPRKYYGNISYCAGEYVRQISYVNYEKGLGTPFAFSFALGIPRPAFDPTPNPLPPIFLDVFRNSITLSVQASLYNENISDSYIYADALRTYNGNSNADFDVFIPYTVALVGQGRYLGDENYGYFHV